jgi:hypothetical protein
LKSIKTFARIAAVVTVRRRRYRQRLGYCREWKRLHWQLRRQVSVLTSNLVTFPFTQLNFTPYGIAIDNARGRIYTSDDVDSTIAVYSTSGTLLHVIQ